MMKRTVIFLMSIVMMGILVLQGHRTVLAQSQDRTVIQLQQQLVIAGMASRDVDQGTTFDLYDFSQLYATHQQTPDYLKTIKTQAQTIQTMIHDNHLQLLDSQVTNQLGHVSFDVPNEPKKAYLIVQRQPQYLTQNGQIYQALADPTVVKMAEEMALLQQVTVQTKATVLTQQPYFFKYGRDHKQHEKPLSGVEFVLYQVRQKQKTYLTRQGTWCRTQIPKQDQQLKRLVSNDQGLVILRDIQLVAGQYFFEEVKTLPDYQISPAARAIQLDVPALTHARQLPAMRLNGTTLLQVAAGQLPDAVIASAQPRIINEQKQQTTTITPKLPETGQAKLIMSLFGLGILGMGIILFVVTYLKRGIKHEK